MTLPLNKRMETRKGEGWAGPPWIHYEGSPCGGGVVKGQHWATDLRHHLHADLLNSSCGDWRLIERVFTMPANQPNLISRIRETGKLFVYKNEWNNLLNLNTKWCDEMSPSGRVVCPGHWSEVHYFVECSWLLSWWPQGISKVEVREDCVLVISTVLSHNSTGPVFCIRNLL